MEIKPKLKQMFDQFVLKIVLNDEWKKEESGCRLSRGLGKDEKKVSKCLQ